MDNEEVSDNTVQQKLYYMKIGHSMQVSYWNVVRVPGGFIFHSGIYHQSDVAVFVPLHDEVVPRTNNLDGRGMI